MKRIRYSSLGMLLALLFASTLAAGVARADDADDITRDSRVISARAGRVNFVSGDVRLRRAGSLESRALTADDELKSGDTVTTGASGRVEILLNPGSYFRAGAGSEFTLAEADLDDLRVELARGSAVVEAAGNRGTELWITVVTQHTTVRIIRSGIYRINALADGRAEVGVFDGRAVVDGTPVKGGKLARAGVAGVEVTKLDKKNRDELDLWSRDRGKELARANEKLRRRDLNSFFARNRFEDLFGYQSGLHGFWFYSNNSRCYTFVPFGGYSRSPYGHWYGTGVITYPSPTGYVPGQNPPQGGTPSYGGGSSGGGGSSSGGGSTAGGAPQGPPPPSPRPSTDSGRPSHSGGGGMPERSTPTPRMDGGQPRRDN
ncbi:MAG TPA: FecR domain-containing protein [Pyrinomonadaceae bacterium]